MEFFNDLQKPVKILAPMVGNSGLAYRRLARRYGADICYTEMVHTKQFLQGKSNGYDNLWYQSTIRPEGDKRIDIFDDGPLVIQICGNNPEIMLEAAKKMQKYCHAIDINFGCPQNIARKGFYGSYLQDDLQLTSRIINTLSSSLEVPLFCKIRIFPSLSDTLNYTKMIENSGCSLLAVHGRTREQKGINTGLANWDYIKEIKGHAKIPVISNGNILYHSDLNKAIEHTKCDGVMVAETHLYNPLIFQDSENDINSPFQIRKNSFDILLEYLELCKETKTKNSEIKSHVFKILHNVLNQENRQVLEKTRCLYDFIRVVNDIKDKECDKSAIIKCTPRIRKILSEKMEDNI